jgi:hypothetical protein
MPQNASSCSKHSSGSESVSVKEVDRLLSRLPEGTLATKIRTIDALTDYPCTRIVKVLEAALVDSSRAVRKAAVTALVHMAKKERALFREKQVGWCPDWEDRHPWEAVTSVFASQAPIDVRLEVVVQIGKQDAHYKLLPGLLIGLNDPDRSVREPVFRLLTRWERREWDFAIPRKLIFEAEDALCDFRHVPHQRHTVLFPELENDYDADEMSPDHPERRAYLLDIARQEAREQAEMRAQEEIDDGSVRRMDDVVGDSLDNLELEDDDWDELEDDDGMRNIDDDEQDEWDENE